MSRIRMGAIVVAVVVFLAGYGLGYRAAPREILDEEVSYPGARTIDTRKVLSATVESLKAESKLVSYRYTGMASVSITRDKWIIFEGHQKLSVPATVSYFVDLSQLQAADVSFDEAANLVVVALPKLMLSVAFEPERAIEVNEGSLTLSDAVVQELRKLNYQTARKAVIKQAQQQELVRLAREQTMKNIASFFAIPLRASGKEDIQVRVVFQTNASRN